jgi:amidohydrolase
VSGSPAAGGTLAAHVDDALAREMVQWRRHLHENPELSSEEHETTRYIAGMLESWGLEVERPLETGAVARIGADRGGGTLALRADIDALPVHEESGVPFASQIPGRMHACGHDGHTAILLAVARVLAGARDELDGEVRLIFQPAEETIDGGAHLMVDAGVLDGVDAIFGLHLWSPMPTGRVAVDTGRILASMDEFRVTVRGAGGHGGMPHTGRDALVAAAEIVTSLQTIVSRRVDPLAPAVVTVGTFEAGTAFNVLAGEARLTGTARALSEDVRGQLERELETLVAHGAAALGQEAEFEYRRGAPVLVNDERMAALLAGAAAGLVGAEGLTSLGPMMGGEDFAEFARRVPGAYAFVGAAPPAGEAFPHHHPRFAIDEAALEIGLRLMLDATTRWFAAARH